MTDENPSPEPRMNPVGPRRSLRRLLLLTGLLAATACTSGGGGGEPFMIESVNLQKDQIWKLNRPIRITFNRAVDFSTVSLNTINIRRIDGAPSAGEFFLEAPNVVVFQPRCPLQGDLSDAGLQPGGVVYELSVLGVDKTSALTVRSADGVSLGTGDSRRFVTPDSTLPSELFFDPKAGSPVPVVRTNQPQDDAVKNACYIELGGDSNNRVYFERNVQTGAITLDPPGALPLNKLSDPDSQIALMLFFDQPVDPSTDNLDPARLAWQFLNFQGVWRPMTTQLQLVQNCTQTGSLVRVEPQGILPPATDLRFVVSPEFTDIVGQTNLLAQDDFAPSTTSPAPAPLVDQFLEEFADTAFSDTSTAPLNGEQFAEWGGGQLRANYSFTGTGGPNGSFDWKVPAGATIFFSTDSQTITGGPNFGNSVQVTVLGGVLDVNDLRIEAGAKVKVIGSNPLVILASGNVEIFGELNVSGTDSVGVTTLNTTNIPEVGAPGSAGGGRGGTGSPLITASSPRGGNGAGAFNLADAGGQGGETGWTNIGASQLNSRRGAGGGGGTFGPNQPQLFGVVSGTGTFYGQWDQTYLGLDAEPGFPNTDGNANGALSGPAGPFGGNAGPSPFGDTSAENDFFGLAIEVDPANNYTPTGKVIVGELKKPWAGAGGGAGGDASYVGQNGTFPQTPFNPNGDEKGAGGAGGGGSLRILSLKDIVIGSSGRIVARGGSGGGGENTLFLNRVGGGSGGGSGGHVILEAAGRIDFSQVDKPVTITGVLPAGIIATGGQGGAGKSDTGGATAGPNGKIETPPYNDACPPGYPLASGNPIPVNSCADHVDGAGGDGGPGIIQLHAPNLASIVLKSGVMLQDICEPNPVFYESTNFWVANPSAPDWQAAVAPTFGRTSLARSKWIALGEGGFSKTSPTYKDVEFSFDGINTTSGVINAPGGQVPFLPAILGPVTLAASGVPSITGPFTLSLDGSPLTASFQYLLDSPELMDRYVVRLSAGATVTGFNVVAVGVNPANNRLTVTVDSAGQPLTNDFGPGSSATLHPAFFRVASNGVLDSLPSSATVALRFQVTTADPVTGLPSSSGVFPASGFTSNPATLNGAANNDQFRYLRFEALFDIDALNAGLSPANPIPSLDFVRLPFRYN